MLLTLSQPGRTEFGARAPHEFMSPPLPLTAPRFSPKSMMNEAARPSLPASITPTMSNQHRGLPPPAAMTLPDPSGRPPLIPPPPPPPPAHSQTHGHEAPRAQWQDDGDGARNWHATRVEEERRRQEEEKTRQEQFRLEQRRVEHSMLRESMQGGIPPHMVPMIFAGIGGANLANFSLEALQQYTAHLQAAAHQVQAGQDAGRDQRGINPPPASFALPSQPAHSSHPGGPIQPPPQQQPHQSNYAAYHSGPPSPPGRRSIAGAPKSVAHAALPRLTTGDMQINPPPSAPSSAHPLHQTQTIQQEQPASSPSIYFHHWVPPSSQSESKPNNHPHTPITGTGAGASHLSEGEHTSSPRKRKNQAAHQAAPPPSTAPSHSSPSFSTTSSGRRGGSGGGGGLVHDRTRSNASARGPDDSLRHTPGRRDSGAPGTQIDFVYERGGAPPTKNPQLASQHSTAHSTAPPSPRRY